MIIFSFVVCVVVSIACVWKFVEWSSPAIERWLGAYMSANPDVEWVRKFNAHIARIKRRKDFTK